MTEFEALLCSVEDGVATVTLNRPDRMNTLGGSMKTDLWTVFGDTLLNDRSVRCVVLTGSGDRAFCAGADIKERAAEKLPTAEFYARQKFTHDLTRLIETFERPVIAAVNGVALGGGMEIALCADIILAADHARFGLPEVNLGVLPAAGGTQRLPRRIGVSAAKELMFTGRMFGAEEAKSLGLLSRVVPAAELAQEAGTLAKAIAEKPPLSVSYIKSAVNAGIQNGIEAGLEYERLVAALTVNSDDRAEGMSAFLEKRKPTFTGS